MIYSIKNKMNLFSCKKPQSIGIELIGHLLFLCRMKIQMGPITNKEKIKVYFD